MYFSTDTQTLPRSGAPCKVTPIIHQQRLKSMTFLEGLPGEDISDIPVLVWFLHHLKTQNSLVVQMVRSSTVFFIKLYNIINILSS